MTETSDDYDRVICCYDRYRIVRCSADIQFIVQRRGGGKKKRPWAAIAYVYDKEVMPRVLQRRHLSIPQELINAWEAADV